MFLPYNYFMTLLKTQALHPEHHSLQCMGQGVREGNLGGHFLSNHCFSQRLPGKTTGSYSTDFTVLRFSNVYFTDEKKKESKLNSKFQSYRDAKVRCTEPERCLAGKHLVSFSDFSRQGQHKCCLIHQLVLVLLEGQHPLNGLFYGEERMNSTRE